jgi:hypothetical protein
VTRRLRLIAALLALGLLAGCVSIPTSGNVQTAPIDTSSDDVATVVLPPGPVDGQTPVEILQGFLRAGRAPQGPYSVAQQFLAPGTEWNGTARVLVTTPGTVNPVALDADTWAVTVTVVGEVDATGRYTTVPSQQQTVTYDIAEIDGQNRIVRADPGTVLTSNAFTNAFRGYPLYFFDPSFDYLVPDLRWFPATRAVADRIVDELLVGSSWLGPGVVVSAFPDGSEGTATYSAPEVSVDLDSAVRAESAITQLRMLQQLRASLKNALTNVTDIGVTAGGLQLDPADGVLDPDVSYSVRYAAIGGADGSFGSIGVDGVSPIAEIGTRADALEPSAASLSRDRTSVAVLGPAGVLLVRGSGDPVPIDARPGLVGPTLDVHGYVWSVPRDDPGGLIAMNAAEELHELPLPVDGQVMAIAASRDGARLLVALATAEGPRLLILGIQRDADFAPVVFSGVVDLDVAGSIVDIAWVDGTHVAVLWNDADGTQVDVLALGGPSQSLGEIDGAVSIAGGTLVAGIRALLADGTVRRPSEAGGWRDTGLVASFLGTQQ